MLDDMCICGWPLPQVAIEVKAVKPPTLDLYGIVVICPICGEEHISAADALEKMPKPC